MSAPRDERISHHTAAWIKAQVGPLLHTWADNVRASSIAELGGGARPLLASERWDHIPNRAVFDISTEEMELAATLGVSTKEADLARPLAEEHWGQYDLAFSRMLCEHLADGRTFHENVFLMLRPGGVAIHYYPTLGALPFVVNRYAPEDLGHRLLGFVQPARLQDRRKGKFPAFYDQCRGPSTQQVDQLCSTGFSLEHWYAGFGHSYYHRIPPLDVLERAKTNLLVRSPVHSLTSYALVVLRKPD